MCPSAAQGAGGFGVAERYAACPSARKRAPPQGSWGGVRGGFRRRGWRESDEIPGWFEAPTGSRCSPAPPRGSGSGAVVGGSGCSGEADGSLRWSGGFPRISREVGHHLRGPGRPSLWRGSPGGRWRSSGGSAAYVDEPRRVIEGTGFLEGHRGHWFGNRSMGAQPPEMDRAEGGTTPPTLCRR